MTQAQIKIHISQINTSVGDLTGNCQKILSEFKKAEKQKCDLVVFCEMTISGYPAQDLWLKKYFISEAEEKIVEIMEATKNSKCAILLGAPTSSVNRAKQEALSNSAVLIEDGKVVRVCNKKTLANYGVFDEKRYFDPSPAMSFVEFRGLTLAILICEDLWDKTNIFLLKEQIFDVVIAINSSPYSSAKQADRRKISQTCVKALNKPLIYVNQIGGQDSLVFDGASFVMNQEGETVLQMNAFEEDCAVVEITKDGVIKADCKEIKFSWQENHYKACVLGLRDYIRKNNFKKVLLGMSGGIDSALVATMAVDALGSGNVALYALPSRYNSESSMIDAQECSKNLGVNLEVISIEETFEAMLKTLSNSQGEVSDLTQQNIQSRIRGNILMSLSNNSGALLLSTGNKSEMACGYATLYGDMCGAFNPIKDLYKTEVFALAKWRNQHHHSELISGSINPIPQNIINKAPTAELKPNQKDSDSLPDYEILDKILFLLIEEQKSLAQIKSAGLHPVLVDKVASLLQFSEYKRWQSCLGPKISTMSFDKERRYPLTNNFFK